MQPSTEVEYTESVCNMDYMFSTEKETESVLDVFAEYGGWDNINIDVLISKPVVWNFTPLLENLKSINWKFAKKIDEIKHLNWTFQNQLDNIYPTPLKWNFINQLKRIPPMIWPFKPQLLKLKEGKWYFPNQLSDLNIEPVLWSFRNQMNNLRPLIWGFSSQMNRMKQMNWSFLAQVSETMRKQRAFIRQLGVSKIRWTFKSQTIIPLNWCFSPQLAELSLVRWCFDKQLHERTFPIVNWSFKPQVDCYRVKIAWNFKRVCDDIRTLKWNFTRVLGESCYGDDHSGQKINWKFTKNLDSAISQSSVSWHFRPQLSSIKKVNWNFETLIPQTTVKSLSLEQVQDEKKEFQDKYLDSYHKPYLEYRKAVHSKHKRIIDYKHSERKMI